MKYKIIELENKDFPDKLKRIKKTPKKLYMIGNTDLIYEECFAIVGSRRITEYGIKNCYNFTKEFALRDIPVVSGLAIGTDTIAHKTVLEYGGRTIAVLGSGFNNIYPEENIPLFEKIIEQNGLVITEYELNEGVVKKNFPERNRIITALSEGVLVIEASYRSGTSITVNKAKEQGKKVFAIPGRLDNYLGIGVNNIIKKGGILTTSINDIVNERNYKSGKQINYNTNRNNKDCSDVMLKNKKIDNIEIKSEYRVIYDILKNQDYCIEEILLKTELDIRNVLVLLTKMELEGLVINLDDGKYRVVK